MIHSRHLTQKNLITSAAKFSNISHMHMFVRIPSVQVVWNCSKGVKFQNDLSAHEPSQVFRHVPIVSPVLATDYQVTCFVKEKMITTLTLKENQHVIDMGRLKVILAFKPSSAIYITVDQGKEMHR